MNRPASKLNPTDTTVGFHPDILKSDSLKVPKLLFQLSLRAANSLATSIKQSLSVLCLWVLRIVRSSSSIATFSVSGQKKSISRLLHWLLDVQDEVYIWL